MPKRDLVYSQAAHGNEYLLAEIFRAPIGDPLVRARAQQAALGGDDECVIGVERFADQAFADLGTVAVRSVDEVDAEVRQAPQRAQGFITIPGLAPDAVAGDAHGAEAEAIDSRFSKRELAALAGDTGGHWGLLQGGVGSGEMATRRPADNPTRSIVRHFGGEFSAIAERTLRATETITACGRYAGSRPC